MNSLTPAYVRKHHLDPAVFRMAAARLHQEPTDGLGMALFRSISGDRHTIFPLYLRLLLEAMADGSQITAGGWWPTVTSARDPESRAGFLGRVMAFELCALLVEDLRGDGVAPGHNPDRVTVAQVGRGWRLLQPAELRCRRATRAVQAWDSTDQTWRGRHPLMASSAVLTYRTRKPAGFFLTH